LAGGEWRYIYDMQCRSMRCIVLLLALLSTALLLVPAVAAGDVQTIPAGDMDVRPIDVPDGATVEINVELLVGDSITVILLDDANYELFDAGEEYVAEHESTVMDRLTITKKLAAGSWHLVLIAEGSEIEYTLTVDVRSGSPLELPYLPLGIVAAVAIAAVVAIVMIKKKRGA